METFHTGRLLLRLPIASDAARITELISAWSVLRMLAAPPHPYRLEHAEQFLACLAADRDGLHRAITLGGELIGLVSIETRDRGPTLGYWLGEAYWGRGYMSEAATGLVHHFFASTPSESVASGYFVGNGASWRIQDKLGFRIVRESVIESRPWRRPLPHIDTELTRNRFRSLNS